MKKSMLILSGTIVLLASCERSDLSDQTGKQSADATVALAGGPPAAPNTFKVFDQVLFFDGYAATVTSPAAPAGTIRVSNAKYAKMLTATELAKLSNSLDVSVTIKAYCDNYDRIGYVGLALIPKGTTYSETAGKHIEIGRFITPFMDKNKTPNTVPYVFSADNIANLIRDAAVQAAYDIYVQLFVFGVPYAANNEIAGCAGHNETSYGTVEFVNKSGGTDPATAVQVYPIAYHQNLNNYNAANTDQVGTSKKTYTFSLASAVTDAKLYVVTSAHGANSGGEEYNRRDHYIYFDNVQKLTYKPGGISCEPYRVYNTQANGIYGCCPKTLSQWTSWNNWCPGNTIPIRVISLGNLTAGSHSVKIDVPTAQFAGQQGNIVHSFYLQGR